jgi:8-oxo-dGTP pyrophosphatase MutT (NUDIX family)
MIRFERDGRRFMLRAAAIVVHDGSVLLQRLDGDTFWALPGGRVELGETAADALRRELREELGLACEVGALRWTVENFFDYAGVAHHELGLYFDAGLPPAAPIEAREPGLTFAWFPLDRLAAVDLRPAFLIDALTRSDEAVVHRVVRDGAGGRR